MQGRGPDDIRGAAKIFWVVKGKGGTKNIKSEKREDLKY